MAGETGTTTTSRPTPTGRPRRRAVRRVVLSVALMVAAASLCLFLTTAHAYIYTPSMYPTIPPGSMVFIEPQRDYHVGEVIEFKGNGLMWVHRLIKIKPNGDLVTKGDNPENKPDVFVPPLTMKDVVGSVVVSVPFLGFPELIAHQPSYGLSWLRAELGFEGKVALVTLAAGASFWAFSRRRRPAAEHTPQHLASA